MYTDVLEMTILNHFPGYNHELLPIKFRAAEFSELLKYNDHPQQGLVCCRTKLTSLQNEAETKEREDTAKIEAEQLELQKRLARLYSVYAPTLHHPRKKYVIVEDLLLHNV